VDRSEHPGRIASWLRWHVDRCTGSIWAFGAVHPGRHQRDQEDSELSSEHDYAFWSDKAHGFQPVPLFPVTPLTEVTATLSLSDGRWAVRIRDADSGEESRFTTPQEGHASFGLSLWLQEDRGDPGRPDPYPALNGTEFHGLTVDGAAPAYAELRSQWLTAGATTVGPSPLAGDSFEIAPKTVSAAGSRYIQIVGRLDPQIEVFDSKMAAWTGRTAQARITAERTSMATAERAFIHELEGSSWPAPVKPLIRALNATSRVALAHLQSVPGTTPKSLTTWRDKIEADQQATYLVAQKVRRALDVPQIGP
jgi:hypothetical protein